MNIYVHVIVQLKEAVVVTSVTVEHIPKELSPYGSLSSAPKTFRVLVCVYACLYICTGCYCSCFVCVCVRACVCVCLSKEFILTRSSYDCET